jgi:tRNA pseudouridine55 synthase
VSAADGLLLCDKPAGITSHDVVAQVRRRLGRGVKVGHAGTLDPFATGLLVVLVGRATKVQRFVMEMRKRYEVTARFGAVSTTGGQRAYKLARAGVSVEMPERQISVYSFDETRRDGAERDFVIECSSGTYVRSLIADLGDAYCTALRRTRIGEFDVADADPERLLPLEQALPLITGVQR